MDPTSDHYRQQAIDSSCEGHTRDHTREVMSIAMGLDGETVVSGSSDNTIRSVSFPTYHGYVR